MGWELTREIGYMLGQRFLASGSIQQFLVVGTRGAAKLKQVSKVILKSGM